MKPKTYFCPHCGQKGIFKHGTNDLCMNCNNVLLYSARYLDIWYFISVFSIFILLPILQIFLIWKLRASLVWLIVSIVVDSLVYYVFRIKTQRPCPGKRLEHGPISVYSVSAAKSFLPHVCIEIVSQTKKIHNLDAYLAVFANPSQNVKFRELYKDGKFPLFFCKKKRKQSPFIEAYIPYFEYIPQDMFFVGSEFVIVDDKGGTIANCKVNKIYQ